jgi:hypothetical protein
MKPINIQIAEYAKEGAKIGPDLGKMCSTCAFKLNSDANLEPHNAEAAMQCLAYYMAFNCHKKEGGDKGCECIGFKYAKRYLESLENHHA